MKTLRARFNLILGTVLIVATLLPIFILYLLSETGLVEATYVTEARDLRRDELSFYQDSLPIRHDDTFPPIIENPTINEWPIRLPVTDPMTGDTRLNLTYDPTTGLWKEELFTDKIERVEFSSPVFHSRVDLPAWIVIGTLPILGLLIGFVLSLVMSRSVTHPISQLAEAAGAIGQRELGYRVETKGSKELIDLALSFNRMAEQLEHAEANRRNLMADVAHELRTPLSVLDGNLRAMLDGVHALNEEEIALLYEQTHHLNRLVDDLRDLSLAEANQLSLNRQAVDLICLVRETSSHFELLAQEQDVKLNLELAEPLIHPSLDENRIRQVLHNLLVNAFHHTPSGGKIVITAKPFAGENAMEIAVADTGAGISPDDLPRIFDRFYQAENSIRSDRDGTGLGLAIAKAIVNVLGGTIHAKSGGKGQGSMFIIRFPVETSPEVGP